MAAPLDLRDQRAPHVVHSMRPLFSRAQGGHILYTSLFEKSHAEGKDILAGNVGQVSSDKSVCHRGVHVLWLLPEICMKIGSRCAQFILLI